jgi:hypothetical protein
MSKQYSFLDRSADRKYFTILPNLLWLEELALTVYDITLYATVKRIAGENGTCYMSTANLATQAKMSAGQVSKSKARLVERKLIAITTRRRTPNGHPIDHITVTDIWEDNVRAFANRSPGERTPSPTEPDRSPGEQHRSLGERYRSPGETEEEPINKNPEEEPAEEEENPGPATAIPNPGVYVLLAECGIQEPNLSILSSFGFSIQEVRAWILYVKTQALPGWRGYLVNRLKHQDPPPPDFLQLATLRDEQLDALATLGRSRHWAESWQMVADRLAQEGISEMLAELWYQNCGKEVRK